MRFTAEEMNMIAIYNTGSRQELINILQKARLESAEPEISRILDKCIRKVSLLTDDEFSKISFEMASEDEGGWEE